MSKAKLEKKTGHDGGNLDDDTNNGTKAGQLLDSS